MTPRVSVLMPTFGQVAFIRRAIESLRAQALADWELLVLDDGSPDDTADAVRPCLEDARIRYERWEENVGLGAALNRGLDRARGELIAYLPSDDLYFADHLESLVACLAAGDGAVLAHSGVRHHYNRNAAGAIDGAPLQLVQVMHRRTADCWIERDELVTDDLERMYWSRLRRHGGFVGTGRVTCEWVDHPGQRHKVIREPEGGLHAYRERYGVRRPLRFHSSVGNRIDEIDRYRRFRERPDTPPAGDGLKILLVGELAYNAERVLALEERGHRLFGLWMPNPHWYNAVGPLPFGHVTDLPRDDWRAAVRQLQPDVIYALLNWQAVPFAHEVMREAQGIPFVWHFKEGPFICLNRGTWPQLIDLYRRADGRIWCSPEMRDWFETVVPGLTQDERSLVLDGDLPKRDWFDQPRSGRLSEADGEIHTVVPGRPIGLHPHVVAEFAKRRIHLHFYGDYTHGTWKEWIDKTRPLAEGRLHLHPNADQEDWVAEFSRYDAGWLHCFSSNNGGDLRRANWDDLNYPARIATLAVAGVPMLQSANPGGVTATERLIRRLDLGVVFSDVDDLADRLGDRAAMARLADNVWNLRAEFTFDHHADRLAAFFRHIIGNAAGSRPRTD